MSNLQNKVDSKTFRVVTEYSSKLKENLVPVEKIILFGSQARGTFEEGSDIDVLVVVEKLDKEMRAIIIDEAFNLSLQYDVSLIAIPCDIDEFTSPLFQEDAFYKNINNEGITIS